MAVFAPFILQDKPQLLHRVAAPKGQIYTLCGAGQNQVVYPSTVEVSKFAAAPKQAFVHRVFHRLWKSLRMGRILSVQSGETRTKGAVETRVQLLRDPVTTFGRAVKGPA